MGKMKIYFATIAVSNLLPLLLPNAANLMPQIKAVREATIIAFTTERPALARAPTIDSLEAQKPEELAPAPSPVPTPPPPPPAKKTVALTDNMIIVPFLRQNPEFPTGCESAATTMVLNFYGFDISLKTFIDDYLPRIDYYSTYYKTMKGTGLVFDEYFVGDPRTNDGTICYEPVIKSVVDAYFKDIGETGYECLNSNGMEFDEVLAVVDTGIPVVVWITMYLKEPRSFTMYGVECYAPSHTVVITGFDKAKNAIYVNDSLAKAESTKYKLDAFEKIYKAVGKRAIIIRPIEE